VPNPRVDRPDQWRRNGFYGDGRTVAEQMALGASRFPRHEMIFVTEQGSQASTLGEIHARGVGIAGALYELGIRPGDVIAVQLPTCLESAVAYQAACALGLVVLPIVPIYGPAEVGFILRQARARAFVIPGEWHGVNYVERLQQSGPTPHLTQLIVLDGHAPEGGMTWTDLESRSSPAFPRPRLSDEDLHMVVYTSGSTAEPKGVKHPHRTLLHEARAWSRFAAGLEQEFFFQPNPVGHMAGILATFLRPFVHGQRTVALEVWDAKTAVELMRRYGTRTSSGVSLVLDAILETVGSDRPVPLDRFVIGGGDLPVSLIRAAIDAGCLALRSYGSTEHPTVTGMSPDDPDDRKVATDGRPMPGVEVRIVDDDGADMPAGGEGEIWTIGPEQFLGYVDEELDRDAFSADGWFKTGDLGRVDDAGFLTVTGRKKDIIIRGGENISTVEVERTLLTHPAIREVAVTGTPDSRYGQRVVAFVVLRDGAELDLEGVRRHFAEAGLSRQKTPEALQVVVQMPRTALGKVDKQGLRELLTTGTGTTWT